MAVQEGAEVGRFGEDTVGVCPQSPAVRLCRTAEVTSTGVGICALGHPQRRGCLRTSGTCAEGSVYSGPLTWPRRGNIGEGGTCLTVKQAGWPSQTQQRRSLITVRHPVLSQDISLQRSGCRRSLEQYTTQCTYVRVGRRCRSGSS